MKIRIMSVIALLIVVGIVTMPSTQAEEVEVIESLELPTYYPAPYGEYDELYGSRWLKLNRTGLDTGELRLAAPDTTGTTNTLWNFHNRGTDTGFGAIAGGDGNKLYLTYYDGTTWSDPYMVVTPSGRVGIDTTSPGYKLDVNGSIDATDYYKDGLPFAGGNGYWAASGNDIYNTNPGNIGIGTQAPSQTLDIIGSLELEPTTTATSGVIYKGVDRFIHNFKHPTGGGAIPDGYNTFVGVNAGNFTMGSTAASNYEGSYNTALGENVLSSNTWGYSNTGVGANVLYFNTSGYQNSALGAWALYFNTTGYSNNAIGVSALCFNTSGYSNNAIGARALRKNTTGNYNVAIGDEALLLNTEGSANLAIGTNALRTNMTGGSNVAVGHEALFANTEGVQNSAVGHNALYNNTTGGYNSAMGAGSLFCNTTGNYNSAFGFNALSANTTGSYNTAIGHDAGLYLPGGWPNVNRTSTYSVYIGYDTRASADGVTNENVFGNGATGSGSNSVTLGNSSVTKTIINGNVGIGTTLPAGTLDVNGTIYQSGLILHPDYVFEPGYKLESIEDHSKYMWQNKHLKAVPKAQKDESGKDMVEYGAHSRGILEELEKAHLYIQQLNERIKTLESKINELEIEHQARAIE